MKSKTIILAMIAVLCIVAAIFLLRAEKLVEAIVALVGTLAFSVKFAFSLNININSGFADKQMKTILAAFEKNATDKEKWETEKERLEKTIADLRKGTLVWDTISSFLEKGEIQKAIEAIDTDASDKDAAHKHIAKAQLYILNFQFDKAEQHYIKAADISHSYDTNLALADFYNNQNMLHEAIEYYARCLNFEISLGEKATVLNLMGNMQSQNNDYSAEKSYQGALEIYRQLAEKKPKAYLPDVAMTLNNLAILYEMNKDYPKAEKEYDEALEIQRQLAEKNPKAYLPDVAITLNNLAILHRCVENYPQAKKEHDEALEIRRKLAQEKPKVYLPDVATTLNNLANVHADINDYYLHLQAEKEYDEALEIRRKLAQENPKAYLPDVATTLNNLAVFYQNNVPNKELSLQYANEAIETLDQCNDTPFVGELRKKTERVIQNWQQ